MSSLRLAAKMLLQPQRVAHIAANFTRAISTSAPKTNFGNHEMVIAHESVRICATQLLSESNVVDAENNSKKTDNPTDKSDGTSANVPKQSTKDEMPAMTIVDINSGSSRRMDFEDRMDHMDLVDRMKDAKLPESSMPMVPLIRDMPSVVDIDAFHDDMMYQDKPEKEEVPETKPAITPNAETVDSKNANSSGSSVPFADGAQNVSDTPSAIQQETAGDVTVKAAGIASHIDENICIAPVDIDAFPKEDEDRKQGTVDIDAYDDDDERLKLPPIPTVRNNVFEFKGIKVIMPKRMLRPETYRYRLDPTDMNKPDDIHICVFEK